MGSHLFNGYSSGPLSNPHVKVDGYTVLTNNIYTVLIVDLGRLRSVLLMNPDG